MRRFLICVCVLTIVCSSEWGTSSAAGQEDDTAPDSAEDIARMLESRGDDWNIARTILRSDPRGEAWIRKLVKHENPQVRLDAIECIGGQSLEDFEGCLRSLLEDPVDKVRWAAWTGLISLGRPELLEYLGAWLRNQEQPPWVIRVLGPVWMRGRSGCSFDWSPSGKHLAVSYGDGRISIWDVAEATVETRLEAPEGSRLSAVFWSPDGCSIGGVASNPDQVLVWRRGATGDWSLRDDMDRAATTVATLAWWPSQHLIVSGFCNCLVAWDTESGKLRSGFEGLRLAGEHWRCLAASPRGDLLAAADRRRVHLFHSLEESEVLVDFEAIDGIAWSPSGDRLAVIGRNGGVSVWSVAGRQRLWKDRRDAEFPVRDVSWSPDGSRIAQTNGTGILVRNSFNGEPVANYECRLSSIRSVKWAPTGGWIATNGPRGVVLVWKLPPAPRSADLEVAEALHSDESRLGARLSGLWEELASKDLGVSGKAERLFAALGDSGATWLETRIRESIGPRVKDGVSTRLLRAVSALAGSVGPGVDEILDELQAGCGEDADLQRLLVWAAGVRGD